MVGNILRNVLFSVGVERTARLIHLSDGGIQGLSGIGCSHDDFAWGDEGSHGSILVFVFLHVLDNAQKNAVHVHESQHESAGLLKLRLNFTHFKSAVVEQFLNVGIGLNQFGRIRAGDHVSGGTALGRQHAAHGFQVTKKVGVSGIP